MEFAKLKKKIFMGMWKNNRLEGNVIVIEDGKLKKQLWTQGRATQKRKKYDF